MFDVSEANNGTTYTNLSEALTAVPVSKRTGGLTIKFIKNTSATYSVVKTDGVTEEPTGAELQDALVIESGNYTADQLPVEAPATSVTYYVAVTETVDEQEVTTYTTWVITKATDDSQEYVQYRLMSTKWSTVVSDWQGVDDEPVAGSKNLVESGGVMQLLAWIYKDSFLVHSLMPYIEMGNNKFKWIAQGYGNINSNGEITESTTYRYSYIFPIKPNTIYRLSGISNSRIALYDVNLVFKRLLTSKTTFTTNFDEVYVRFATNTQGTPPLMLNEGEDVIEYEPFSIKFKSNLIPEYIFDDINSFIEHIYEKLFVVSRKAYNSSGYVSINGEEKVGTSMVRTGYLSYNGGDIIAYGACNPTMYPVMVFFSGESSDNCLGYFPNPRTYKLDNKLVVVKESDIPEGTAFVRFNGNKDSAYYNNLAIDEPLFVTREVLESAVTDLNVEIKSLINNVQSPLVKRSTNIADKSSILSGYNDISTNGDIVQVTQAYKAIEDFIPIKPNTAYISANRRFIAEYDVNYNFLVRHTSTDNPFTSRSNATYIRFSYLPANPEVQINEGDTLLEYEPYYDYKISDSGVDKIKEALSESSKFYRGLIDVNKANVSNYYSGLQDTYVLDGYTLNGSTQCSTVIELYDKLMETTPEYITKTALGTISGTDRLGDSYEYTMYEYAFVPPRKSLSSNDKKRPKIIATSGMHGFEKNGVYGLFFFLKDLVENWDKNPALSELRWHTEIRVMPLTNPWGFDHDDRWNPNHINICRNFPVPNWQKDEDEYGDEPLDQQETQIIADWITANRDALMGFDIHTNGHYYVPDYPDANYNKMMSNTDPYYMRLWRVLERHIEEQTFHFRKYDNVEIPYNTFIGISTSEAVDTHRGTAKAYFTETIGMLGMTLECLNGIRLNETDVKVGLFSPLSKKMCSEIIGNWFIQMLCEYSE